jgi:hypothetical protein
MAFTPIEDVVGSDRFSPGKRIGKEMVFRAGRNLPEYHRQGLYPRGFFRNIDIVGQRRSADYAKIYVHDNTALTL